MTIDLDELERLEKGATILPWTATEDGIIQTRHFTRDVWTIPRQPEDLGFIAAMRNAAPELLRLARIGKEVEQTIKNYDSFVARNSCAGGEHAEGSDLRPTERKDSGGE
jgi:hypothetical protein